MISPMDLQLHIYVGLVLSMFAAIFYEEYNVAVYVLLIWAYENDKTPKPLYIGMVTVAFSVLTDVISHGIEGDKILGSKTNKFANKAEEDLGKFCVVMSVLCTILKLPLLYVMYKEYKIRGGSTMIPGASASANSYSSLDAPGLESS